MMPLPQPPNCWDSNRTFRRLHICLTTVTSSIILTLFLGASLTETLQIHLSTLFYNLICWFLNPTMGHMSNDLFISHSSFSSELFVFIVTFPY